MTAGEHPLEQEVMLLPSGGATGTAIQGLLDLAEKLFADDRIMRPIVENTGGDSLLEIKSYFSVIRFIISGTSNTLNG